MWYIQVQQDDGTPS
jgi:hypothetical protein